MAAASPEDAECQEVWGLTLEEVGACVHAPSTLLPPPLAHLLLPLLLLPALLEVLLCCGLPPLLPLPMLRPRLALPRQWWQAGPPVLQC
jgi:hypothetical protein